MIARDLRTFVALARQQDTDIARIVTTCNQCDYQETYVADDYENEMMMATLAEADMANHINEEGRIHNDFEVGIDVVEPLKTIDVTIEVGGMDSGA